MKVNWIKFAITSNLQTFQPLLPLYSLGISGPKVLVIIDQAGEKDYETNHLLKNEKSGRVFENLINFSIGYCGEKAKEILVINLSVNSKETPEHLADSYQTLAKERVIKLVEKYQPDSILLMGERCNQTWPIPLFPDKEKIPNLTLMGRVSLVKFGEKDYKTVRTLALDLISNERNTNYDVFPNLIGLVGHHFATCLHGKNRCTINLTGFRVIYLDTLSKFNKFYRQLWQAKIVSLDTEGENLQRINNQLYSIQFSFDGKTVYFLPIAHPETPWTPQDLRIISQKLKRYFERGTSQYHIGAHYRYDLMQFYRFFKLRWYNHEIFDIANAEFGIDENIKFLDKCGLGGWIYSLDALALRYGSDIYHQAGGFKKSERANMKDVPLKRIINYGGYDVVLPYQISEFQLIEAARRGPDYKKFLLAITQVFGVMTQQFARMELQGFPIDRQYLMQAASRSSGKFAQLLQQVLEDLYNCATVKKANQRLLQQTGAPTTTLLGSNPNSWVFDINKPKSQQELFFSVLKLKPLAFRKDGGGKIGALFQQVYKKVKEVALFAEFQKVSHLYNAFITKFLQRLTNDTDMADGRLRPNFINLTIISGRSGQRKPSLQQLPSRESKDSERLLGLAKLVKRQFVAPHHCAIIEGDFLAHEVRNWGLIANDPIIASAFQVGLTQRQTWRLLRKIDQGIRQKWAKKFLAIDIHRINHQHFYGKPATKVTKEERYATKAIVFGTLYGKGAKSLAQELKVTETKAQELIDRMYEKFAIGGKFVSQTEKKAQQEYTVVSPLGVVRHLWGYMHWHRSVYGKMNRRGPNSVIQGTSSQEGFIAGRECARLVWELFVKRGQPFSLVASNSVHDSLSLFSSLIELPISLYLIEHAHTTQLVRVCQEVFDWKLNVSPEIDLKVGGSLGTMEGWNMRKRGKITWADGTTKYGTVNLAQKTIEWANSQLSAEIPINKYMHKIEKNTEIIDQIRKREISKDMKLKEGDASTWMEVTPKNSLDYGFIFQKRSTI